VLAGGGSSLVYPAGGNAVPGLEPKVWPGPIMYYPSSPLHAIEALAPGAKVVFDNGSNREAAARLAAGSDVALVFVTQWTGESVDKSLTLPDGQDELVAAVAAANPHIVVVIEAGGAVFMPWVGKVPAVLHAWYPGTAGGEAIANILFGIVNPSGHLPISLPKDESQFARAALEEKDAQGKKTLEVNYAEGAVVGYKWFDAHGQQPLFAFGHGLSYTNFEYSHVNVTPTTTDGAKEVRIRFRLTNTGSRTGTETAQAYVTLPGTAGEPFARLVGWDKVTLEPGQATNVQITLSPADLQELHLLQVWDSAKHTWTTQKGTYAVQVGGASDTTIATSFRIQ